MKILTQTLSRTKIEERFGISQTHLCRILNGRSWTHIK